MMIGFLNSLCFSGARQEWLNLEPLLYLTYPFPKIPKREKKCNPPRMMIGFLTSLSFSVTRQEWLNLEPLLYLTYPFPKIPKRENVTRQEWWYDSWPHFVFRSPAKNDDRIPDLSSSGAQLMSALSISSMPTSRPRPPWWCRVAIRRLPSGFSSRARTASSVTVTPPTIAPSPPPEGAIVRPMIPTNKFRHSLSLTSFLAGWPKNKVRSGILSSFLAGGWKRKWGQESYHHSWRVTEKESEVRNPIIIFGGWPKNKVRSGILSSFLAGDRKRKWGQESYHHSWRVTEKQSEVRNLIIILGGGQKKKVRSGILSSVLRTERFEKLWHKQIILGSWHKRVH